MEKIIKNGTQVLLFKKINGNTYPNEFSFLEGFILKSEQEENGNDHDSLIKQTRYIIQCSNGEIYKAVYGNTMNGYCIRTPEDYLIYVNQMIKICKIRTKQLEDEADKLNNLRLYLKQKNSSKLR